MASFQVQPPEIFTFKPEDWLKWSRRFERFRMASGLEKESEESQVNNLIYSMGSEADDIVQSLGIAEGDQKKYDVVKKKLEDFFTIKRNVIFGELSLTCEVSRKEKPSTCLLRTSAFYAKN
jgi:hypothetical protein